MAEMLSSIAVIGILSGVMISKFSNVKTASSEIIANEMMEAVNLGLKKFNQIDHKITTATNHDSSADEAVVLGLLQTRDNLVPGSPFVRPDWNPVGSDSNEDYRIQWAGKTFQLLKPGTDGHGLKVDFEASDYN